jgi:hypothetical protein
LVHRNRKYKDWETAVTKQDGLLGLAMLYKPNNVSNNTNDAVRFIVSGGATKQGPYLDAFPARQGSENYQLYHYRGSMTDKPCGEAVDWFVFTTPIFVSQEQIDELLLLRTNNCRLIQPLNGRQITQVSADLAFEDPNKASTFGQNCVYVVTLTYVLTTFCNFVFLR